MVNEESIQKLISELIEDLPKLKTDQSYFYNEPMYFNYAGYYDSLCESLSDLDDDKTAPNLFGVYLMSFVAYQILDLGKELWEVVEMIIEQLQDKLTEMSKNTAESKYQA